MLTAFNVRVYGIFISEEKQVLVTDERITNRNMEVTKFPGGGLEFGEGTKDCLIRECIEEMNVEVEVLEHIYTTDFFQQSAFKDTDQLISIYYRIKPLQQLSFPVNNGIPIYPENVTEAFRLIDWDHFSADMLTLPIDKIAATIVKEKY